MEGGGFLPGFSATSNGGGCWPLQTHVHTERERHTDSHEHSDTDMDRVRESKRHKERGRVNEVQ